MSSLVFAEPPLTWLSHVSAGSRVSQALTEYFSPRWMDQSRSIVSQDQELPKQKARMIFESFPTSLCGVLVFCWLSAFSSSSSRHPASSSLCMTLVYQLVSIIILLFKRLNPHPIKKYIGALGGCTPPQNIHVLVSQTRFMGNLFHAKNDCLSQRGAYLHSAPLCPPYCLYILGAM